MIEQDIVDRNISVTLKICGLLLIKTFHFTQLKSNFQDSCHVIVLIVDRSSWKNTKIYIYIQVTYSLIFTYQCDRKGRSSILEFRLKGQVADNMIYQNFYRHHHFEETKKQILSLCEYSSFYDQTIFLFDATFLCDTRHLDEVMIRKCAAKTKFHFDCSIVFFSADQNEQCDET